MLVGDVMHADVVTIEPATSLAEAVRLAQQRGIRHLPVLDGNDLVGIVSDRDLKRAMASPATSLSAHELRYLLDRVRVGEIMTRAVITTGPMLALEEAARVMVREKISALPVTEMGRLVGIVTETDVLDVFVRALGAGEPSSRLDVVLDGAPGALAEVVGLIAGTGASISSVVTLRNAQGLREAVVRIASIDARASVAALRGRGYAVREASRPVADPVAPRAS